MDIKKLYAEAAQLHQQAKALLDKSDRSQEEDNQIAALLDQVESKIAQAKQAERAAEADRFLNDPATRQAFFTPAPDGQPVKIEWNGKTLTDPDEIKALEARQPFKGFIPALDGGAYHKALIGYLRDGNEMRIKALTAGTPVEGGYLVSDTFLTGLIVKAREASAMRRISRVLPPVPSGSVISPAQENWLSDATWTTEVLTGSADTVDPFGERRLTPHPLAKRILTSNTLLRTPGFDVEAWIRDNLAYRFAVPEEYAFINGSGVQQPLGILNTTSLPVWTTDASNVVDADDVINWVYALPAAYAGRATILSNRAFIRKVRTMKGALGEYVWQPGLQMGSPNRILDTPYEVSDQYDDGLDASDVWEDNAKIAVIGDFSYYWIVAALSMSIQRLVELYAASNQVGYIGRKETDGRAVLAEAFYALKVKA